MSGIDIEVMQKAIEIAAVAERYMVAGDLDGASVLVDMADMYVGMARELRIGNRRMTTPRTRSGAVAAVSPVYEGAVTRKTVNWDITEPLPAPEPYTGGQPRLIDTPSGVDDLGPIEAAQAFEGGLVGPETAVASTIIDGGEPFEGEPFEADSPLSDQ